MRIQCFEDIRSFRSMKKISHGSGQLSERFEGLKYAWCTSDWEKYAWGTSDWEKSSRTKILTALQGAPDCKSSFRLMRTDFRDCA